MAVDSSIGVLIAMCAMFFCITVVALLLYLRRALALGGCRGRQEIEARHEF
eukprot:gene11564-15757_t